jgi:hypothetical protein
VRSAFDALILTLLLAALGGAAAVAADPTRSVSGSPAESAAPAALGAALTPDEVRAAAAKLRADPNLGGTRKIRSLRRTAPRAPDRPQNPPPWIEGLFEYLGQTGSLLLWVVGAIAAALAVLWTYRTYRARTRAPEALAVPAVARVGELDIRPESLPPDIGAAALALAEAGKTREALSLLYRGALSRAVHRFGIAIGESYTEGEALNAVGARLDPTRLSYFSDLVGIWRRTVYAGEALSGDPVRHLCRGFAALDAAVP